MPSVLLYEKCTHTQEPETWHGCTQDFCKDLLLHSEEEQELSGKGMGKGLQKSSESAKAPFPFSVIMNGLSRGGQKLQTL